MDGQVHVDGVESSWTRFETVRAIFCRVGFEYLNRFFPGFTACHNVRCVDTMDQMSYIAESIIGRRLSNELISKASFESADSLSYSSGYGTQGCELVFWLWWLGPGICPGRV